MSSTTYNLAEESEKMNSNWYFLVAHLLIKSWKAKEKICCSVSFLKNDVWLKEDQVSGTIYVCKKWYYDKWKV